MVHAISGVAAFLRPGGPVDKTWSRRALEAARLELESADFSPKNLKF